MVKKTKRNNKHRKLKGGFSWPWSKDDSNPNATEEKTAGFLSYFTGSNQSSPESPTTSTSSYFGLENIKMPEFSNPFSSSPSTENYTVEPTTTTTTTENYTVEPTTTTTTTENYTVEPNNSKNSTVSQITNPIGGRRRKSMRMRKGGYRGLGLTYYATPVDGIKVAEPTYMEYYTGGKRSKKTRKQMRKKCRKNCRKSHRHIR